MPSSQDLRRLVNGASLIGKEFTKRSQVIDSAISGDLQTLISSSAKRALLSAIDLTGLTKGKIREFAYPCSKENVVCFTDSSEETLTSKPPPPSPAAAEQRQQKIISSNQGVETSSTSRPDDHGEVPHQINSTDKKTEGIVFHSKTLVDTVTSAENVPNSENPKEDNLVQEFKSDHLGVKKDTTGEVAITQDVKKRRRRERKVPSTSFGRALGKWGISIHLCLTCYKS